MLFVVEISGNMKYNYICNVNGKYQVLRVRYENYDSIRLLWLQSFICFLCGRIILLWFDLCFFAL